jgi:hypothetical protein
MTGDSVAEAGAESFRWSVRLSDKAPAKRWVVLAAAALVGVFGLVLMRQPLLGLLGFAIILAATAEFWLGASYRIDGRGASSRTGLSVSSIDWQDVKRLDILSEGAKLSPLSAPSRLDEFRGVFLRFGDQREQVLAALRTFGGEYVRLLEG